MALNKASVFAFILRELGYGANLVSQVEVLIGKEGPIAEAALVAVIQALNTDLAAFSGGTVVVTPPVAVAVVGNPYVLTLHFDPAPKVPQTIVTTPSGDKISVPTSVVAAAPVTTPRAAVLAPQQAGESAQAFAARKAAFDAAAEAG